MNNRRVLFIVLFNIFITPSQELIKTTLNNMQINPKLQSVSTQGPMLKLFNTTQNVKDFSITLSDLKSNKKWQIGRVTNKQYGIINLLWQKTKIFVDMDYSNFTCKATTVAVTPEDQDTPLLINKLQTSTPSYIEFYYLDYTDERKKHKTFPDFILQNQSNIDRSKRGRASAPSLFKIRVNTVARRDQLMGFDQFKLIHMFGRNDTNRAKANKTTPMNHDNKSKVTSGLKPKVKKVPKSNSSSLMNTGKTISSVKITTKSRVTESAGDISVNLKPNNENSVFKNLILFKSSSPAYDKVKFFEIYDSNTPEAYKHNNLMNLNTLNITYTIDKESSSYNSDAPILLQHVNEETGHEHDGNKTRYVKKHIQEIIGKKERAFKEIDGFLLVSKADFKNSSKKQEIVTSQEDSRSNGSRLAAWSEFPFVAVYIYEPSQVRCDAASISPHWLLAAASCLSRHRRELHGGRLTAFVAFCSHNWREPQRISYVKRTLIHPRYHPRDKTRRYLYNAGVIQIVNSMADTCNGWAPVSLMSHQFTADREGSIATAVGWGLDRYDKLYTISDLPRHSLMIYENLLYTQSCPGNFEYSDAKASDEDGIRNMYCLLLPPYVVEESDPVHGALLLIGGKLLALYLQEERRPWGVQSAQYTGLWKLVPWLTETAREPDDYLFQFDI